MSWRHLFLALLLLISGCGIPLDSAPVPLEAPPVEPGIIGVPGSQDLEAVTLFLVKGDGVTSVTRDLIAPPSAESILDSLLAGTTGPEERANLRTSIPPGTENLGVEISDGVALVSLGRQFTRVGGDEEILAVAQIVLSLAELAEIDVVRFLIGGIATAVPVADGALTDRPVGPHDYRVLVSG